MLHCFPLKVLHVRLLLVLYIFPVIGHTSLSVPHGQSGVNISSSSSTDEENDSLLIALEHLPVSRRDAFPHVLAKAKSNHLRLFASLPPHCHVKSLTCSVLWTDFAGFHRLLFQSTVTWHSREGRHAKWTRVAGTAKLNVTPRELLGVSLRRQTFATSARSNGIDKRRGGGAC